MIKVLAALVPFWRLWGRISPCHVPVSGLAVSPWHSSASRDITAVSAFIGYLPVCVSGKMDVARITELVKETAKEESRPPWTPHPFLPGPLTVCSSAIPTSDEWAQLILILLVGWDINHVYIYFLIQLVSSERDVPRTMLRDGLWPVSRFNSSDLRTRHREYCIQFLVGRERNQHKVARADRRTYWCYRPQVEWVQSWLDPGHSHLPNICRLRGYTDLLICKERNSPWV